MKNRFFFLVLILYFALFIAGSAFPHLYFYHYRKTSGERLKIPSIVHIPNKVLNLTFGWQFFSFFSPIPNFFYRIDNHEKVYQVPMLRSDVFSESEIINYISYERLIAYYTRYFMLSDVERTTVNSPICHIHKGAKEVEVFTDFKNDLTYLQASHKDILTFHTHFAKKNIEKYNRKFLCGQ